MSHHEEDAMLKEDKNGSAFSGSESLGEAECQQLDPQGGTARGLYRGALRIELPYSGSLPCTSPASPADVTATTTHRSSPRTAIYRTGEVDAFQQRELEAYTPTTVEEHHAHQSAIALLHADISAKAHLSQSAGRDSTKTATSLSPAVSGSFEMVEAPRKRAPLQQFFASRSRKQRSTLSTSSNAFPANSGLYAREISTALDLASGTDQETLQHSHLVTSSTPPRHDSGTSDPHLPQLLSSSRMAASLSSMERLPGAASTSGFVAGVSSSPSSPPPQQAMIPTTLPPATALGCGSCPGATAGSEEDVEDSCSSSGHNIGMEAVLRDASKVRGIRLTWLLYLLLIMVMVLFALLLVQIIYESNRTLVRTGTQAVRAQASGLVNTIDIAQYSLTNVFVMLHDLEMDEVDATTRAYAIAREMFCSRFYGAPMAFAFYNRSGGLVWSMRCSLYPVSHGYRRLPEEVLPGPPSVRLTDFTDDAALAIRSFYSDEDDTIETYVILMDKETLGRVMLSNYFPQYSSATLQYLTSGFLTRMWNSSAPALLFHTLTSETPNYTSTERGPIRDSLFALFHDLCYEGSPYIWHTVSHYESSPSSLSADSDDPRRENLRWPIMSLNDMPPPHLEYGRSWGQLSVANFCGVHCYGEAGDTECAPYNPTNMWFVVEYSLMDKNGLSSILNVVGIVSIVALILFSFVMFLVYISITVPVNFLRVQLLTAVGAVDPQSNFQRWIVRWTYRLWLGDLTAIVRSTHILSLCFRLNKRYVPDHVLRNHAQQLYLRRRKFNFLGEVDVKEDPSDREGSEFESDVSPAVVQLPGVSTVMPSSENRFLWRCSATNDLDEPARQSSDGEAHLANEPAAPAVPVVVRALAAAAAAAGGADVPPLAPPRGSAALDGSPAYATRSKSIKRSATYVHDTVISWPVGELDGSSGDPEYSFAASALPNARSLSTMNIRRDSESTILCVRIPSVELAYLLNYGAAVVQHRRVMRILLSRIRRHKGALFHRSGDALAAVWNAFEGCPNHAEIAAACAQEIANAFAPFRADGLHMGVVLHQGVLVCGSVEYSTAAFVTAFGDGPREAFVLADLAASMGSLNVLVSEPVKQSLSGLYDCNIVDVVQLPASAHPLLLFELCGRRLSNLSTHPALRAQFAVEYARVFAQFRNHEFSEALHGIEQIRLHSSSAQNEHLLRRLERLCFFYATAPAALPLPYSRAYPSWVNYEAIAQAGLRNSAHFRPPSNNSLLSRSFHEGAVYAGVPAAQNDVEYIKDFKQELQENMRRTARKGNGSPTMDESSTRPHITPQSSPPLRPTADSTVMSEPVMSVGSGMETMGDNTYLNITNHHHNSNNSSSTNARPHHTEVNNSSSAPPPPKSRYIDAVEGTSGTSLELFAPLPAPVTAVPGLATVASLPLLTFPATNVSEQVTEHASQAGSSARTTDSPRDVFALSNRFAMTHKVTNRPPVALAAASPELADLTAQDVVVAGGGGGGGANGDGESCFNHHLGGGGGTLTHPSSFHGSDRNDHNNTTTDSIIQSAGMSFKNSVNGGLCGFNVHGEDLPSEITAKSGTKYLRSTRILGKGSFGCVYLGMDAHSGRLVAIKFLPMPSDESGMEDIEAEVLILQRVNDTHVVQLLSYAFEGDTIVIVMECMLAGSLQNMISAFGSIPSSTSRVFMRDVLRGLSKIHSMGVIHRDMKPQNVLLSLAGNCKISDFGASAWLQELARKESHGQICGTPVYLAPEAARGNPAKESDIWSCGIMFLQMITGALPYPPAQLSAGAAVLVFQIGSGIAQPQIPTELDELDAEFVRACLQVEPSRRLTAAALLQLPIFTV